MADLLACVMSEVYKRRVYSAFRNSDGQPVNCSHQTEPNIVGGVCGLWSFQGIGRGERGNTSL